MNISRIAGWILTGLVSAMLAGPSAISKFIEWDGKAEQFGKLGFTTEVMTRIGFLEVALVILYLIPRTSFTGAVLLTGYLGGAVVTHLRVGEPFFVPIIIGVVMWLGYSLRQPAIFQFWLGSKAPTSVRKD